MKKFNKIFGLDLESIVKNSVNEILSEMNDPITIKTKEEIAQKEAEKAKRLRKQAYQKLSNQNSDIQKGILPEEGSPDEDTETQQKVEKAKPVKLTQKDLPDIDLNKVIEKINKIRAGESLKDKEVKQRLGEYWDKLNGNERVALYAFMSGIAKILDGIDGERVKTPGSDPFELDINKEQEAKTIDKKDIKNPEPKSVKTKEQQSSSPIVVGEMANKYKELKVLKGN